MGDLHVQIRLHGSIVEDRVVPVRSSIVVGDWPGATVGFPGASVQVSRAGTRLRVLGRSLQEDESTFLDLGEVHVHLSHTNPSNSLRTTSRTFDRRFLATAIVMIAVGAWIDAAEHWSKTAPESTRWTAQSMVQERMEQ